MKSELFYSLQGDVQILTPLPLSTERDQRRTSEEVSKVIFQNRTLDANLRTHDTDSEFLYSLQGDVQILTPPRLSTERDQRKTSDSESESGSENEPLAGTLDLGMMLVHTYVLVVESVVILRKSQRL